MKCLCSLDTIYASRLALFLSTEKNLLRWIFPTDGCRLAHGLGDSEFGPNDLQKDASNFTEPLKTNLGKLLLIESDSVSFIKRSKPIPC